MRRLTAGVLATVWLSGCASAMVVTTQPTTNSATTGAASPGAPESGRPPGMTPATAPVSTPTPNASQPPVIPSQAFRFLTPRDGAVLTGDTVISLAGVPAGGTFTLTIDGGTGPQPATLEPMAAGQLLWRVASLPDAAYTLRADVTLPNGVAGIARSHVRLFRRPGVGGGGGGVTAGAPAPVAVRP
ncbi:MAG: hypothetical protein H7338_14750, partial [Candidatus Sericytochromatia bacterium]|nr:hypothetical protein [Candidatus Sericytochromatia bacterium]